MKKTIFFLALVCSLSVTAQRVYRTDGTPQRFVNAFGIPIQPATYYNSSSDSAILFFDRNDTNTVSFRFKGLVKKLGLSRMPWDSIIGIPANFTTTYALSNDVRDSIQSRVNTYSPQTVGGVKTFTNEIIMPKMTVDTVGGVAYNSPWRALGVKTNIAGVSHWHGVTNGSGVGGGDFTFFKSRPSGQPLQLNDEVWYSEWRARFRTGANWELSDTAKIFDDVVTVGNTTLPNQPGGLRRFRSVYNGSTVTALSINHLGQVGIRRDNQTFDLDINGTLRSTGAAQFLSATVGTGGTNPTYIINGGSANGTGGGIIGRRGGTDIYSFGSSSWITSGSDNSNNTAILALANFRIYANNSTAVTNTFSFSNNGFTLSRYTAKQASALTSVADGTIIYVTSTNETFTAIGFWGMENTVWVKL